MLSIIDIYLEDDTSICEECGYIHDERGGYDQDYEPDTCIECESENFETKCPDCNMYDGYCFTCDGLGYISRP